MVRVRCSRPILQQAAVNRHRSVDRRYPCHLLTQSHPVYPEHHLHVDRRTARHFEYPLVGVARENLRSSRGAASPYSPMLLEHIHRHPHIVVVTSGSVDAATRNTSLWSYTRSPEYERDIGRRDKPRTEFGLGSPNETRKSMYSEEEEMSCLSLGNCREGLIAIPENSGQISSRRI